MEKALDDSMCNQTGAYTSTGSVQAVSDEDGCLTLTITANREYRYRYL